jgi:hypothetical protein
VLIFAWRWAAMTASSAAGRVPMALEDWLDWYPITQDARPFVL